ncbi:inositol monophosphatase family protein [Aestuariirhabdus sp. LZHN29]|uniref:inositol monophosphatase family protein n=1 Tax=Aestuariirhabdus sp. LZHN29 TaxID=3417462 RepID=UPI003CE8FA5D
MQPMLNIALRAARKAGEIIVRASEDLDTIQVREKGTHDYVTEVDRNAERAAIAILKKAYPDHGFLGEESGHQSGTGTGADYLWIIDPLDGTTNFIHGVPHYAVSIACQYRGRIEHAVVLDPVRREEFTASRGYGAQFNGKRMRVSKQKLLNEALIATGFPFKPSQMDHLDNYMAMFKSIASEAAGIRRAGAASLDLAYVAAGRYEAFWEFGLNQWDISAGSLLIQEAGGLASDFGGGHNHLTSGNIVCGNPKCFKAILQAIAPHVPAELK